MWRKIRRILFWIGLLCLIVGGWLGWVTWDILHFSRQDQARKSDVAVVLGAAAWDRRPSPVLEERINHAIDLYKKGTVRKLLFTGGFGGSAAMAESEVARDYAVEHGVSADDILIEKKSHSTLENLQEARAVVVGEGLKTVILVSDPLQMRRASAMASDLGLEAVCSPTPTSRYRSKDLKLDFLLTEVYKYNVYLFAGK